MTFHLAAKRRWSKNFWIKKSQGIGEHFIAWPRQIKKVAQRAKVKQMRKAANKSKKLRQKKILQNSMRVTEADITSATFSKGKHLVAKKKAWSKKRPLNSGRSL